MPMAQNKGSGRNIWEANGHEKKEKQRWIQYLQVYHIQMLSDACSWGPFSELGEKRNPLASRVTFFMHLK